MRRLLPLCLAIIPLSCITACEKLQEANEKIASLTNKAVIKYCDTPKETRQALRASVKKAVAPNEITITCASDIAKE